jgi:hypothetical protein
MELRDIYITKYDLTRLRELLQVGISFAERDRQSLESLQDELDVRMSWSRPRCRTMW